MKKFVFLCVFFAFSLSLRAQESGIRFFHGTWDEAIALAKKEKKKIFVDFYTEWCGPCLNMSLTVFVLPQVGEVYNKNFVCLSKAVWCKFLSDVYFCKPEESRDYTP